MAAKRDTSNASRKTSDATAILARLAGRSARMHALIEQERANAAVARLIYEARTSRGLSQKQLADLVGTTQSVIARLEDADYRGHSLTTIKRVAGALGYDVDLRLVPTSEARRASARGVGPGAGSSAVQQRRSA